MLRPPQDLLELCWPADRLAEAVEWLARSTGLSGGSSRPHLSPPPTGATDHNWNETVTLTAAALGIEAEPVTCAYGKLEDFFQGAAPAIVPMPSAPPEADAPTPAPLFLVLQSEGRWCAIVGPDLRTVRLSVAAVTDAFRAPLSTHYQAATGQLLDLAQLTGARRRRVSQALMDSWLGAEVVPVGWLLRPSPGASLLTQIRHSTLAPEMLGWLSAFALQNGLFLLGWWLIGRVVLGGQTDPGWVWAWALLLVSGIPFQLTAAWMQQRFSETLSVIFKQRLLYSALKMNPDDIRHLGAGQLLDRVMDSEAVETLALGGGLSALVAVWQLGMAAWVLAQGPGGLIAVGALGLWLLVTLAAGWANYHSGQKWTAAYRNMTNGLVEKMVGHRTRLAQEDPARRHADEDLELDHYQTLTRQAAAASNVLSAVPASWLIAGLACLIPALLSPQATQLPAMAVGLGGVMLAHQAFNVIEGGLQTVIQLLLSWTQVEPIYRAGAAPSETPTVSLTAPTEPAADEARAPLLTARDLTYRFSPQRRPALNGCHLEIYPGDHLILEGASGGGKTTLAAVLAGLRRPESGLLFLHGYDRHSLGETAWRRRVVLAPQFHENHIFSETFAFNLLMGRRWPPQPEDMEDAAAICQELGLGDLLARMPSGWQQIVGESGWQLSHGERSRVFIARALLQSADLVIMDESFGALDPENLYLALACARRRAKTLLVIAHP